MYFIFISPSIPRSSVKMSVNHLIKNKRPNRPTKFVFLWDLDQSVAFRNWSYKLKQIFKSIDMNNINMKMTDDIDVAKKPIIKNFKNSWKSDCSKSLNLELILNTNMNIKQKVIIKSLHRYRSLPN